MTQTAALPEVLVVNPLLGGPRRLDKTIELGPGLILADPRDPLPAGATGFEVLTARDGGKRVVWSTKSPEQIAEARTLFNRLVSENLVPYYVDPLTGRPSASVMKKFDAREGKVIFEKVVFAPTSLARGG